MAKLSGFSHCCPDTAAMLGALSGVPEFKIAYSLPSTIQYRLPFSLNNISISFHNEDCKKLYVSESGNIDKGEFFGRINADAFIKYRSSTLWGNFHYDNGLQREVRWSESSDLRMVYPYITADAVGGDIRFERYCFSGGYADNHDGWEWGAEIAYNAGQYYRNVDPRPKNITGLLRINAGVGRHLSGPYSVAVGLEYDRYTQSNDITFVSEMGESKIYQLTGLGTHYTRFDGNGHSAHFGGNAINGKIALVPGENKGLTGGAEYTYYKFTKVLDDLNKLPLACATENSFSCEIGWKGVPDLADLISKSGVNSNSVSGFFSMSKRTGNENLFGDPASSIYPKTGTKEAYHATYKTVGLRGFWQRSFGLSKSIKVEAEISESRFHENHLDPVRFRTVRIFNLEGAISGSFNLPARINLRMKIYGGWADPYRSTYYRGKKDEKNDELPTDAFLIRIENQQLHQAIGGTELTILRPLSSKFTLSLSGGYTLHYYCNGNRLQEWHFNAAVIF